MSFTTGFNNFKHGYVLPPPSTGCVAVGRNALPHLPLPHLPVYNYTINIGPGAQATRDHEMVVATEHGFIVGECRPGEPVRPRGEAPRLRLFAWHLGARLMVWASR